MKIKEEIYKEIVMFKFQNIKILLWYRKQHKEILNYLIKFLIKQINFKLLFFFWLTSLNYNYFIMGEI